MKGNVLPLNSAYGASLEGLKVTTILEQPYSLLTIEIKNSLLPFLLTHFLRLSIFIYFTPSLILCLFIYLFVIFLIYFLYNFLPSTTKTDASDFSETLLVSTILRDSNC